MVPEWYQNGTWYQNGARMVPERYQNAEWYQNGTITVYQHQNGTRMVPDWHEIGTVSHYSDARLGLDWCCLWH